MILIALAAILLVGFFIYSAMIVLASALTAVLGIWFAVRVLRRAGFSGWWAVSVVFPPALVVLIWLMAFVDWPAREPAVTVYRPPPPPRP